MYHQLQLIHPNGQIELYSLNTPHGLTHIGHQPPNDVILSQAAPFRLAISHHQTPLKLINLGSTQPISLKGQPLPPQVSVPLQNLDVIQVGGYTLILLENPQARPTLPATSARPYPFSLSELTPKSQILPWSRRVAQLTLTITHHGEQPCRFRLEGRDRAANCTLEFDLPAEPTRLANQAEFSLLPQQAITIQIYLTPRHRPFISLTRQQSHYFTLTVTQLTPHSPQRALLGEFHQRPVIGPGLLTLGVIALTLLTLPLIQTVFNQLMTTPPEPQAALSTIEPTHALTSAEWRQTVTTFRAQEVAARFYGQSYSQLFREVGHHAGLDDGLLTEIAYRESRFNPLARGPQAELGLMQIPLEVWQSRADALGLVDPYEPYSNLLVASDYLIQLKQQCSQAGYLGHHWVLAGYKLGPDRLAEIFKQQGTWADVPLRIRRYALDILQASAEMQIGPGQQASWQAIRYQPPRTPLQTPYDWLKRGQVLTTSALSDIYHPINPNDTLATIAKIYEVTEATIEANPDNHLTATADFKSRQWLIIPQAHIPEVAYAVSLNEAAPRDALIGSGVFMWPIFKNISQDYSPGHPALDLRGSLGAPILAADSGYIVEAGWLGPYGNAVIIDHGNGFQTLYAHMSMSLVVAGQNIIKGEPIGLLGSTGNSTGPHVHFEIRQGKLKLNPITFLPPP